MTRPSQLAASVLLALVGASCGRVGLDRPADDAPAAGGATDAAHDAANVDGAPVVDAMEDAAPPLAATILRVTNVGAADFALHLPLAAVCPFGFLIQGGAPVEQPTSLAPPDTICDCDTCASAANRRPRCEFTDFICDDASVVIAPGAHFDSAWDRIVLAWLSPPPAASQCAGVCSAFVRVPAGRYTFTLEQPVRDYAVQATLPSTGGIIEIPVGAP